MSQEAKITLLKWLKKMANQKNDCLQNLIEPDSCETQLEMAENMANPDQIAIYSIDNIDYCHIDKWYDDEIYQDMKSGKYINKYIKYFISYKH